MDSHFSEESLQISQRRGLLHLPRELRDQIYHELWDSTILAFRHDDVVTIARCGKYHEDTILNRLPAWLVANRQICNEGMQQFYCDAHFTVGEHYTLPLFLYRECIYGSVIAPPKATQPGECHDFKESIIKEITSDLLTLERARRLAVKDLCIQFEAYFPFRRDCQTSLSKSFCTTNCCPLHANVSICPGDGKSVAALFEHFDAIESLFRNGNIALRHLRLEITPGFPILRDSRNPLGFSAFISRQGRDVQPEAHYDWRILDMLPNNLRSIQIAIIDDIHTPRGGPAMCTIPLGVAREVCEHATARCVGNPAGGKEQGIDVRCWTYRSFGKSRWLYKRPRSKEHQWQPSAHQYLYTHWEAISPTAKSTAFDETDAVAAKYTARDSVISAKKRSHKVIVALSP
ncbi:hypothetical protein ACEQ8H_007061 [Pleosporales sp. CAS-2024a]